MPVTYTYECPVHGRFDTSRRIGDRPDMLDCPTCGAESAAVFSVPEAGNVLMPTARFHDRIGKREVLGDD
jgi:putative FmdB family regulatory protein